MKQVLVAIIFWFAVPVDAQSLPDVPTTWRTSSKAFWHAGIDYPLAAIGGFSIVIVKERTTSTRGYTQQRGMIVTVESGLGGIATRLGYASLFHYDAGGDGFSVEAVYVKPWLLRWGLRSGENYVGPGMTFRFGYLRLSGAALIGENGSRRQLRPSVTFGIAAPFTMKR